ncbi:MAG: HNH endonuclease [Microbacteriaceae bacterium]|nr:HNH endonuclease [Microbacteriaceae bacterium]
MKRATTTDVKARFQVITPAARVDTDLTGADLTANDLANLHAAGEAAAALAGYGPIDTMTARFLASCTTTWDQVQVHPITGNVITVDTYRPSAAQRRFLAARDQHCRFPGCRVPIHRADIDHTIAAADGGKTATTNLAVLCRRHHTMKHATPWRVAQNECGDLTWVSPTGRLHRARPTSRVRFMPTRPTTSPPGGPPSGPPGGPTGSPPGAPPSAASGARRTQESTRVPY